MTRPLVLVASLPWLLLAACASTNSPPTAGDANAAMDAGDAIPAEVRGTRYCEILLGTIADGQVHIDVFSTEGLNDCPDAAWAQVDEAAVQTATAVDIVILNGPRYWTLDSLEGSTLLDATPRTLGGIAMRRAGSIDLAVADVATANKPYQQHTIHRQSAFRFLAGKTVYELVDPAGHVYAMQSYSVQQQKTQTEQTLAGLAAQLTLPTGWTFRTRVLDADLVLLASDATAIVTQDNFNNTYSLAP